MGGRKGGGGVCEGTFCTGISRVQGSCVASSELRAGRWPRRAGRMPRRGSEEITILHMHDSLPAPVGADLAQKKGRRIKGFEAETGNNATSVQSWSCLIELVGR